MGLYLVPLMRQSLVPLVGFPPAPLPSLVPVGLLSAAAAPSGAALLSWPC